MRTITTLTLVAGCWLAAPAMSSAQQGRAADRLTAMDRNRDGVISRQEWTGAADGFEARDWNRDGVLSGAELRPGARRGQARRGRDTDRPAAREFDDWTPAGFAALDRNRDGRIAESEWTFDFAAFDRADHDGDGVVSRAEFLNEDTESQGTPGVMASMDVNRDGQLTRREWRGSAEEFTRRDGNRDGLLSGTELNNIEGTGAQGRSGAAARRGRAYQAGYDRGRTEGFDAGREDRERQQGWDLDGQRELETADSGYTAAIGPRAEYQTGYRDAFRAAYAEGYGRR